MRILIVEDDERILSFLVKGLAAEGYVTVTAGDGPSAVTAIENYGEDIDLVLLDLGLPVGSGQGVLSWMRETGHHTPVIVLTARATVADKVTGLNLGANDYLTKPFAFEELVARIRAAVRSTRQPVANELAVGDLRLDLDTKVAYRAGRRIELAPREWALLELFMRAPQRILSRSHILSHVWDLGFDPGSNVVDVYVGYLRKKLNRDGLAPLILTVRGAGYRLHDGSQG
jgi:DNA-binding response OmpR family regulator